jgi:hypothetical protein
MRLVPILLFRFPFLEGVPDFLTMSGLSLVNLSTLRRVILRSEFQRLPASKAKPRAQGQWRAMIQAIQLTAQIGSAFGNELAPSVIHHHSSNKADVKFSREFIFDFASLAPSASPAVVENIYVPKFNEPKKTLVQKTPSDQRSGLRYAILNSRSTKSQALATRSLPWGRLF